MSTRPATPARQCLSGWRADERRSARRRRRAPRRRHAGGEILVGARSAEPEPAAHASGGGIAPAGLPPSSYASLQAFKDAAERAYIVQKLRENDWNITQTAKAIDTPRSNLYKKLEQYGISRESDEKTA